MATEIHGTEYPCQCTAPRGVVILRLFVMSQCLSTTCSLCSSKFYGRHHFHPQGWSGALQAFFKEQVSFHCINVCFCKACESNIRRSLKKHRNGESFRFRWVKEVKKCCIPFCEAVGVKASRHTFTWEEICTYVGIGGIASGAGPDLCLHVCTQHYQLVYRMKNARESNIACRTCGVKRKHDKCKFLSCPDPKKVESYLHDTTGFVSNLTKDDQICHTCYRFFTCLLKSDVCMLSSEHIVSELQSKQSQLIKVISEFVCTTPDSHVQLALYKTALYMCEGLACDQAYLFPRVYKLFLNTKADMRCLLSQTLYASESSDLFVNSDASILNKCVNRVVKHMLSNYNNCDRSAKLLLDVDHFINDVWSVAPELWQHVCALTQSVNECKGRSAAVCESSFAGRIKRLCRAYLVSLVLFITTNE